MDNLLELETPCLLLDRQRLQTNADRMREKTQAHGLILRPHMKTAKSAEAARIALGAATGPITVATLKEADYFAAHGFNDILYAVCLTPNKFNHIADLVERGVALTVLLASTDMARALAEFAEQHEIEISALVEIDSGEHRTGLLPNSNELIECARILDHSGTARFGGVLTHGGHSYLCQSIDDIVAVAEQERAAVTDAADRIRAAGIAVACVSLGSTPTAFHSKSFTGATEIRPGVYLAGDLFQAQLGTCALEDIAISVLASVIAHDPARNSMIIDAGGLALSKDRSTAASAIDYGYGLLVRADGAPFKHKMLVSDVHQEHGEVTSDVVLPFGELPVGSPVRILPNHVCMTAAIYDRYHVVAGQSTRIENTWDKAVGW